MQQSNDFVMYIEHTDWLTLANASIQIASIFGPLIQSDLLFRLNWKEAFDWTRGQK